MSPTVSTGKNQPPTDRIVNPNVPNVARMYDWYLGGKDNYAADVQACWRALKLNPEAKACALANRRFLGRSVDHLARKEKIAQFLDLGTGFPSQGNVHEVAQKANPDALTMYVDYDPVVVAHGRALLTTDDRTQMLERDLRDWKKVCEDAATLLDFERPIGVLMVASLHFIKPSEDPYGIVKAFMDATVSGSFLVLSHVLEAPRTVAAVQAYKGASAPAVLRSEEDIARFFTNAELELVEPGLVRAPLWRSDPCDPFVEIDAEKIDFLAGVGRKR
ncbi:SAM-dependent methyltransferase [Nonomuraea sp. NEAU-A123]|uniref:SAM-dependent methyltransferase n=1 Tax=Nonomuraea sp. NEAU-A123 TaxID=2839649 RepID=UPI001BE4AA17|nr:SAM-dependent methyltransferase [Nonomuraea sp. NEAU-A123]MBT2225999.1 SAM-dependent methyltransferase [Nonomuraea sp. NEAU-A123]